MPFSFSLQCLKALREYPSTSPHLCYDLNCATTPGNMLDHSESNQIPGSSGPSTESGRDTGRRVGVRGSKNHRFSIKIPWNHPKRGKCVAWATRIDNEGQTVCACQHGVPTVLACSHEVRLFVKPCGWRGTHLLRGLKLVAFRPPKTSKIKCTVMDFTRFRLNKNMGSP